MNSVLKENELPRFFQTIGNECTKWLIDRGLDYQAALKSGNQEDIKNKYQYFLYSITEYERSSGIQIIESPDGSYFCALASLSGIFQQRVEQQKTNNAPVKKQISFTNVDEANKWLFYNQSIIVTSVNFSTGTRLGYFANHATVKNITIYYMEYKVLTGYCYGICIPEQTSLFLAANKDKFIEDWIASNPECEIVQLSTSTHARGDSASLAFGFGLGRAEHNTYFIVYRIRSQQQS